jgi:hypothetical protein
VIEVINTFNPRSFYTIEDVRAANEGIFTPQKQNAFSNFSYILRNWRKGK